MVWIDIEQLFHSQFLNSYNINCFIDHHQQMVPLNCFVW